MLYEHKYFVRGRRTDGDSTDVEGNSMSECINADPRRGNVGSLPMREGLEEYTALNDPRPGQPALPQPGIVPGGGPYALWDVVRWDSGITPVQHNTMLVYRAQGSVNYAWALYSNSSNGGDGGAWSQIVIHKTATHCHAIAANGAVRVAFGHKYQPGNEPYIWVNLCEEGIRNYPNAVSITSSTNAVYGTGDGNGGTVIKGWLWDYMKPYVGTGTGTANILTWVTTSLVASTTPLETADYGFAVVYRYGSAFPQSGLCAMVWFNHRAVAGNHVTFTYDQKSLIFSKRITMVEIWAKVENRLSGMPDDADWRLIHEAPFNAALTLTPTAFFTADANTIEGQLALWVVRGNGRPMVVGGVESTFLQFGISIRSVVHTDTDVDKYISVRPKGWMLRSKRLFAWGLANDPGQTRIAISSWYNSAVGEQMDIFWHLDRIYYEHSLATTWIEEWRDRMFLVTAENSYFIDLERRVDDQSMGLDTAYGIGTTIVRTIVKSSEGIFLANYDDIWWFDGQFQSLTEERWRDEWKAIPARYKDTAVGAFFKPRMEYWLALQTAEDVNGNPTQYSVFVYDMSQRGREWRRYLFCVNGVPDPRSADPQDWVTLYMHGGFFLDSAGEWVLWGMMGGQMRMLRFDADSDDDGLAIPMLMAPQWQGTRYSELMLDWINIERDDNAPANPSGTLMDNHVWIVDFAANRKNTPVEYARLVFDYVRRSAAHIKRFRMNEFKYIVRTIWSDDGTQKPKLNEVVVKTVDSIKTVR